MNRPLNRPLNVRALQNTDPHPRHPFPHPFPLHLNNGKSSKPSRARRIFGIHSALAGVLLGYGCVSLLRAQPLLSNRGYFSRSVGHTGMWRMCVCVHSLYCPTEGILAVQSVTMVMCDSVASAATSTYAQKNQTKQVD